MFHTARTVVNMRLGGRNINTALSNENKIAPFGISRPCARPKAYSVRACVGNPFADSELVFSRLVGWLVRRCRLAAWPPLARFYSAKTEN